MDKQIAKNIVKESLQNSFDKARFTSFIKNLLNSIDESKAFHARGYVAESFTEFVKTYERLGTYIDPDGNKIDILIVYLQRATSLERARTAQRNFTARYLKDRGEKEAGLIAFVSPDENDWRFSFVKMEYKLVETPTGKIKAKEEFTPARRWSFLVGKNENSHTAQKQLLPILQNIQEKPKLSDLENAFNIEVVTKEFFGKYKELFLETTEELEKIIKNDPVVAADFKEKNVDPVNFAKKLLGQIVFLYFLQKKGWLGVKQGDLWGTGPKNFLRKLFDKKIVDYKNFFNDVLEPLFYDALAADRGKESIYTHFNCRIPFLNGGLFDPINGYDWECTDIIFPDELFSNNEKTKEGDFGTGILDVFDRYNFTVKEDEPLEKEVAIDPEMLGKVFENLLEVKDRKSKGSYYTPREIVHYMCQESLINYLTTEVFGSSKEDIEIFIRHGELALEHDKRVEKKVEEKGAETATYSYKLPESVRLNAELIDENLKNIRVCDPAVGSGAFLVGMMNEIIRARNVLSTYLPSDKGRNVYEFKKHAAQNCLYGVDIDPSAVEIAKLRLWLSLVVDEEDVKEIKPLPNLDYKIMQGNSLLEEFEGVKLFDEDILKPKLKVKRDEGKIEALKQKEKEVHKKLLKWHQENLGWIKSKGDKRPVELMKLENERYNIEQYIKNKTNKSITLDGKQETIRLEFCDDTDAIMQRIKDLHKEFFNTSDKSSKEAIKEKISHLEWTLIEATLREQGKKESLARLEEYKNSNVKPFFLWKLHFSEVFQEKGGFDVLIANPPYVQIKQIPWNDRKIYEKKFESAVGRFNVFYFFLEITSKILKYKGLSAFIVPDRLLLNTQCDKLRKWLLNQQTIVEIDSFDKGVFESAVVDSIIIIYLNTMNKGEKIKAKNRAVLENLNCIEASKIPIPYFLNSPSNQFDLSYKLCNANLLEKIKKQSVILGDISEIKDGIIQSKIAEELFLKIKIDKDSKKLLFGKDIVRYKISFNNNWVNYKPAEMMKIEMKKVKGSPGLRMRNKEIFVRNKILTRQTADEIIAAYDTNNYYYSNTLHGTTLINKNYNPHYVLAILNSKLLTWYYRNTTAEEGKVFAQIKIEILRKLPIKELSFADQKSFIAQVDKILTITKDDDYQQSPTKRAKVKEYERKIDEMAYKLYDLTPDEIAIIEGKRI